MKKLFVVFTLLFAANLLTAKQLNVAIFYNQYLNVNGQSYIETYFSLDPRSVTLKLDQNNMWQGGLEILITIEKENEIVAYDKVKLNATGSSDTISSIPYTVQQSRVKLDAGTYLMKIELTDINSTEEPIVLAQQIEVQLLLAALTLIVQLIRQFKT